jgi:DNA topoisomerase-1
VCRKAYVHPAILEGYLDGELARALRRRAEREPRDHPTLREEEQQVLRFLERRLAKGSRVKTAA